MKRKIGWIAAMVAPVLMLTGCQLIAGSDDSNGAGELAQTKQVVPIAFSEEIVTIEDGLRATEIKGDYGFDEFLDQGGASSDFEVMEFLNRNVFSANSALEWNSQSFGCSTLATVDQTGSALFGRNFDWYPCESLVIGAHPEGGYASIATVNLDFISTQAGSLSMLSDEMLKIAAMYAPLDGMNEAGLAVSVNMIGDSSQIDQQGDKNNLTTTTAIRLMLDQAKDVDEAVALLENYNLHGSMGMMVHFAIGDASGKSVVVEYVNNEMVVTPTPVVTNFYLDSGDNYGIGSAQSHQRYEILMAALQENDTMTSDQVRDALDLVSKDNFNEFNATQWSIVFNLKTGTARYYHREDYQTGYEFEISK